MIDCEVESRTVRYRSPSKLRQLGENQHPPTFLTGKLVNVHRKKQSFQTVDKLLRKSCSNSNLNSINESIEKSELKLDNVEKLVNQGLFDNNEKNENNECSIQPKKSADNGSIFQPKLSLILENEIHFKDKQIETEFSKIKNNKHKLTMINEDDIGYYKRYSENVHSSGNKLMERAQTQKSKKIGLSTIARILNFNNSKKTKISENFINISSEARFTTNGIMSETSNPKKTYFKASTKSFEVYSKSDILKQVTSVLYKNIPENDMLYFLMNPLPKNKTLICKIKKVESKFIDKLYPRYDLYINCNEKFLMSGQKIFTTTSSTYLISKSQTDFDQESLNFIGKISSNFIVSQFNIFGKGKKPQKTKNREEYRTQHGAVLYDINLFGLRGPRRMRVYLPKIDVESGDLVPHKPESSLEYIQNLHKEKKMECSVYLNKPPIWSEMYKSYLLKFNGRVQVGSSKNFQLIRENSDEVILQFGMIDNSTFAMDFQHPLTPFQAFSICLTSLATKKACE